MREVGDTTCAQNRNFIYFWNLIITTTIEACKEGLENLTAPVMSA